MIQLISGIDIYKSLWLFHPSDSRFYENEQMNWNAENVWKWKFNNYEKEHKKCDRVKMSLEEGGWLWKTHKKIREDGRKVLFTNKQK